MKINRLNNRKRNKQQGFTLIEVMIAVVVFSFGLLGVAGVMTVAVKNNHNGYMRSQAAFMASSIIDMMRRNKGGVKAGLYDGTYSGFVDVTSMCTISPCGPTNLAARDVQQWSNMITQLLPNSSGTIACALNTVWPDAPVNGFCTVTVNWTESNEIDSESNQTLSIVATP
jgi:type IV pilus assembly protein PilV